MTSLEILSEGDARLLVNMANAIEAIEQVFRDMHAGAAEVFPVVIGHGSNPATIFSLKSGVIVGRRLVGCKIGTYWPSNRELGLANHGSTTLFLDDATGFPRALVSATYLTAMRTAAADGVAIRALARSGASRLAIVGAGHQAWYEILAARAVRPIAQVSIWNRTAHRAEVLAERVCAELGIPAKACSIESAVAGADIVVTTTAASEPLVRDEWVQPGTHISAMGADSRGKQELDIGLIARATCFADSVSQSTSIGEFQKACLAGALRAADVTPIGAVLSRAVPGRRNNDSITIFDSSGLALQDLAIADLALRLARSAGVVTAGELR